MTIIVIIVGIAICLVVIAMFMILPILLHTPSLSIAPEPKTHLTVLMRMEISIHQNQWHKVELSQFQCAELGFLSGDPDQYYCYNTTVEMCGRLVRFTQSISTLDNRFPVIGNYKYALL